MTVSTTSAAILCKGNGVTTTFNYGFPIPDSSSIRVTYTDATGAPTVLTYGTQYTATGLGNPAGGTVTYAPSGSPIATGTSIYIERVVPYTQPTSFPGQNSYSPTLTENCVDRLEYQIQQIAQINSRTVLFGVGTDMTTTTNTLPAPVSGQGLVWGTDGTGKVALVNSALASAPVSSAMQPVTAAASTSAALTLLGGLSTAGGAVGTSNLAANSVTVAKLKDAGLETLQNKIINGCFRVDQRNAGASQTFTAAAALAYCADHWYGYCTGANVTGQRVQVSGAYRYRFTGAASVTGVGLGQRIESLNSYELAGQSATIQVKASSTSLVSLGWALYYANSADAFGSLASPTRTAISSGTFTITTTEATYSATVSIPSAATTGLELVLTGGALLGAQTLTIGDVDIRAGTQVIPFSPRPFATELLLCERYYTKTFPLATAPAQNTGSTTGALVCISQAVALFGTWWKFPTRMRAAPTVTRYCPNAATTNWQGGITSASRDEGEYGAMVYATANGGANTAYQIHATAEIEIP